MSNKKTTILIVEDDIAMQEALADKFKHESFNVLTASNGEEGLKTGLDNRPNLVMLDIMMPKMDGMEVMKKIREDKKWGSEVPIIFLTNVNEPEKISEAALFRVYDFLVKTDWHLDDVVNLVKQKLELSF